MKKSLFRFEAKQAKQAKLTLCFASKRNEQRTLLWPYVFPSLVKEQL
jgi:hypothetical protein